jgi:nucleoside-diphosphate-sugar epimerase
MRVLIVGAGYVGMELAKALAKGGHEVHATSRSPRPAPPGVRTLALDLTTQDLPPLPEEVDLVVFTLAPDRSSDADYEAVYVQGPERLLRAPSMRRSPPKRVVFTSSTSVYGQTGGEWVDESSPTEPASFSGRRMLEAEARIRDACPSAVSLRCSGIYGPDRGRLLERLRQGEAPFTPGAFTNRIHQDDVVRALRHVGTLADPDDVYLASDLEPAPQETVYRWLAERLGAPEPRRHDGASLGGRGMNKRCRPSRLLESGFTFSHPTFREGYAFVRARTNGGQSPD